MPTPIVQFENINKHFAKTAALQNCSATIHEGEIFGFIGPDGAGKTTLFRILTTLLTPDSGNAKVLGFDVVRDYKNIRPLLGYMPGKFSLYHDLSIEENLHFFAGIFNADIDANFELIRELYEQLAPFKDRRAGKLSGGMKQKLALCCALIHKPRLVILDEPTTGVDAVSRREFWDMLARLRSRGISIVVSTPYMDEAQRCDRIALMQNGQILTTSTPSQLSSTYSRPLLRIQVKQTFAALATLRDLPHTYSVYSFGDALHYSDKREHADVDADAIAAIEQHLAYAGITVDSIRPIQADIEDSFMLLSTEQAHAQTQADNGDQTHA